MNQSRDMAAPDDITPERCSHPKVDLPYGGRQDCPDCGTVVMGYWPPAISAEIDITPEMIEAGRAEYHRVWPADLSDREKVAAIYRAMKAAER